MSSAEVAAFTLSVLLYSNLTVEMSFFLLKETFFFFFFAGAAALAFRPSKACLGCHWHS